MKAQPVWRCLSHRQAAATAGEGCRCAAVRPATGRCCRRAGRRGAATCPAATAAAGKQAAMLPVNLVVFLIFFNFFLFYFFKNFTLELKTKKN